MKKPLVVVDTNLFISALIIPKSKPSLLISLWKKNKFILVTSNPLFKELEEVLKRKKYSGKYSILTSAKNELFTFIRKSAFIISSLNKPFFEVRDQKDLLVLATAIDGKADFLVTGDKDLLVLKHHTSIKPLKIVTVNEFLTLVHQK